MSNKDKIVCDQNYHIFQLTHLQYILYHMLVIWASRMHTGVSLTRDFHSRKKDKKDIKKVLRNFLY